MSFLSRHLGYENPRIKVLAETTILAATPTGGEVPVFGFHKLGMEPRFALEPKRFRTLIRLIQSKGWYLMSDTDFAQGDFTSVPSGKKPLVMGSDDASSGTAIYLTRGPSRTGRVRRIFGTPRWDPNCMVAILERFAPRENNRINFTFYISFDAIPFRQLDGAKNPGFPYPNIPLVREKITYLDAHFRLGIHSLSHQKAADMGQEAFSQDVLAAWNLMNHYAGGRAETVQTMAYPYGIVDGVPDGEELASWFKDLERPLAGGFDFDDQWASPNHQPRGPYAISRLGVDNSNWERARKILEGKVPTAVAQRTILWTTTRKRLPPSRKSLGIHRNDDLWVLVKED